DGPLPTHYEAAESPMQNALYHQQSNPAAKYFRDRLDNRLSPVGDPNYPIVITTYRLTEHHVSGPMTRWMPWLNALQPELFAELSPELADERQIKHRGWMVISTPRGEIEARAMVTRRIRRLRIEGRVVPQIGLDTLAGLLAPLRKEPPPPKQAAMGFFTDTSLCIGCKACEVACKQWNQLPARTQSWSGSSYDNTRQLNATTWRHVQFIEQ